MIHAVLFDAVGTLFDVAEPVGETYARFAAEEEISAEPHALDVAFRDAFTGSTPLAFPNASADEVPSLERAWWRRLVFEAFARAHIEASASALDRAFARVFEHYATAGAWRVHADVKPVLHRLRQMGVRSGIVSNFDSRLRKLLEVLDLAPALHAVVLSSECGFAKPDRRIFDAALAVVGTSAPATLYVGDSEELDRRAASEAGLAALRIDRTGLPSATVITHLDQVVERCSS
jgi:putative hydrolase of the HAD superfamily